MRNRSESRLSPRWYTPAENRVAELVEDFHDSLRRITVRFARHDQADSIDRKHVNEAFEALVRLGLRRQPWWKRSELKITDAGIAVGAGLASPDLVPVFITETNSQNPITIGIVFFCGLVAASLYVWGWLQHRF